MVWWGFLAVGGERVQSNQGRGRSPWHDASTFGSRLIRMWINQYRGEFQVFWKSNLYLSCVFLLHTEVKTQQKKQSSLGPQHRFTNLNWYKWVTLYPNTFNSKGLHTSQCPRCYSARLIRNSVNQHDFCSVLFVRIKRDPPVSLKLPHQTNLRLHGSSLGSQWHNPKIWENQK